jgi:hypothetical protein
MKSLIFIIIIFNISFTVMAGGQKGDGGSTTHSCFTDSLSQIYDQISEKPELIYISNINPIIVEELVETESKILVKDLDEDFIYINDVLTIDDTTWDEHCKDTSTLIEKIIILLQKLSEIRLDENNNSLSNEVEEPIEEEK